MHQEHNKSTQSHLGRAVSPPLPAENGLNRGCATICAMPTEDESNHSAAGTLHPQCTDGYMRIAYTVLA